MQSCQLGAARRFRAIRLHGATAAGSTLCHGSGLPGFVTGQGDKRKHGFLEADYMGFADQEESGREPTVESRGLKQTKSRLTARRNWPSHFFMINRIETVTTKPRDDSCQIGNPEI